MAEKCVIEKLPHHEQEKLCHTRPVYRQGKKLTAVKVYTVNDESQHLMVSGVPKLQLSEEVRKLVLPYGIVKEFHVVTDYPTEEFTEVYHVRYVRIQSARIAKRFIDGKNFFGGLLHVFYAPELESVSETRGKLIQRRKDVLMRIRRNQQSNVNPEIDKFIPEEQYHRKKKTPALALTEKRLEQQYPGETLLSIYDGIPQNLDPRPVSEPSLPANWTTNYEAQSTSAAEPLQAPYHCNDVILRTAGVRESKLLPGPKGVKRKNYKGLPINNNTKVRIVRPQLVDTRNIASWHDATDKRVFSNAKKVDSGITIKLITPNCDEKKRIIISNPSVKQLVKPSEDLQRSIEIAKSQIRASMQKSKVP